MKGNYGRGLTLALLAGFGVRSAVVPAPVRALQEAPPGAGREAGTEARDCPEDLEVLVERSLAARASLAPSDRVLVGARPDAAPCEAVVAGVFEPRADPASLTRERPRVLLQLPELARLTGRGDVADRFSVRLAPGTDPVAVARRLAAPMPGAQVLAAREVADRASTTFEVVRRFHRAIGIITITAGGVFLACIMTLKVQERRTQVAALRLIGVSDRTLLAWLMTEAALVSALGGVAGIGLGHLAASAINAWYRRVYDTSLAFALVTRETVLIGLALALVLGLAAGLVAALRLTSVDALEEVGR
jgi:putative ABC transport system permease protein